MRMSCSLLQEPCVRFMVEAYLAAETLSAKGIDATERTCCRTPVRACTLLGW